MKIKYTIKEFDPDSPLNPGDYFLDTEFDDHLQFKGWIYLATRIEGDNIYRRNLKKGVYGENLYCDNGVEKGRLKKIHPKDIGNYKLIT